MTSVCGRETWMKPASGSTAHGSSDSLRRRRLVGRAQRGVGPDRRAGALVVTVITLVNRIELQAASITDSLSATGERTRPLLDLVEANFHLDAILKGGR